MGMQLTVEQLRKLATQLQNLASTDIEVSELKLDDNRVFVRRHTVTSAKNEDQVAFYVVIGITTDSSAKPPTEGKVTREAQGTGMPSGAIGGDHYRGGLPREAFRGTAPGRAQLES